MPDEVLINGSGIAACCCACLLSKAGYRVVANHSARVSSPILMLSLQTQKLLLDVFECDTVFDGAVPVSNRVVAWGLQQEPLTLPHSGLVIPESTLLDRLWRYVELDEGIRDNPPEWRVISAGAPLTSIKQHEFGSRLASTCSVELRKSAVAGSCWVESVASGWLFLVPAGEDRGSLIGVGDDLASLLSQSNLVSDQIDNLCALTGSFPAHPRIAIPLAGTHWIACGTAAVAFDPIAGEGAGNAIREGILASAVIRAVGKTASEVDLFSHYSNRLLGGFLRHLQDCCRFYEVVAGTWWDQELRSLRYGVEWAKQEVSASPKSLFRLRGFELEPLT
jgi:hypothetical protein